MSGLILLGHYKGFIFHHILYCSKTNHHCLIWIIWDLCQQIFEIFPDRIVGDRSGDTYQFLRNRMGKFNRPGMKMDSSVFVGSWKPVFQVSLDVQSNGCQLGPDLVMTAGMQFYLQQVKPVGRGNIPVGKRCFLDSFCYCG